MILEAIVVTLTCYHAVAAQCNEDSLTTASGAKIECTERAFDHHYVAVSQDLLDVYPYGTVIRIDSCSVDEYNSEFQVVDTMHPRIKNTVDVLVNPGMKLTKESVKVEKVLYGDPD